MKPSPALAALPSLLVAVLCWVQAAAADAGGSAGAAAMAEADFHRLRTSVSEVLLAIDTRPDLFPPAALERPRVLPLESRAEARRVWATFHDRLLALDAVATTGRGPVESNASDFQLRHAASVAHYRFSLDFIQRIERDPDLDAVLNEGAPRLGLPQAAYRDLKDRILNVKRAGEFASRRARGLASGNGGSPALELSIREDAARIWETGRGPGPLLTARHMADRAEGAASDAALPVQERLARRMAEIRVRRGDSALISPAQIEALQRELEPGDIFLTRREWYVSNVGIPGFWSHAALYVGSPEERRRVFDTPEVAAWARAQGAPSGALEELLTLPPASPSGRGATPRVLEAIAEGVAFTTLERAAHADSIAVLRPALPRVDRARAVWRAFHYAGRPYDYDFDFRSDDALVRSELVYKAYREIPGEPGLALPLTRTLGRPMISPNELARLYAEDPTERFELVAFLDGDERLGTASRRDAEAFRTTWSRPKWHILLPADDAGGDLARVDAR